MRDPGYIRGKKHPAFGSERRLEEYLPPWTDSAACIGARSKRARRIYIRALSLV